MANNSRYRVVDWIGGRILEARELMSLQGMLRGVDPNGQQVSYDLDQLYRPGATQNIKANTSGLTVSFAAVNSSLPMAVFVRGRWETVSSGDLVPVTLSSVQTRVYLNYAIRIVTSDEDTSLVDSTTGEASANMGELDLSVSASDTSAVPLNGSTQLEKNTQPIVLFQFTNSGTVLTPVVLDNAKAPARATLGVAGLVSTTTSTAGGVVASTDDPRLTDQRAPTDGSVTDSSVRTPLATGGVNADGSSKYSLTLDRGGISADKIIWQSATERLTDFLSWLKAQIVAVAASLAAHTGQVLGLSNTHPMPTALQVGAAPLSHVGAPLGQAGSHPASVAANSGGFEVNQTSGAGQLGTHDAAFGVYQGSTLVGGLLHSGDVLSTPLNSLVTAPGGSPLHFSGALTGLHDVAQVVTDHVNQNPHGNPHGLAAADIGAASTDWVNSLFNHLMATNGCYVFPGGFTIMWGREDAVSNWPGYNSVSFPTRPGASSPGFANNCFTVVATTLGDIARHFDRITYIDPAYISRTGFHITNNGSGAGATWIAVGN